MQIHYLGFCLHELLILNDFLFLLHKDYYIDLLFYHRGLRRLVLLELKLGEFEPQDKRQVELYLRWLNKYEKAEGEENPIASILCAETTYDISFI